MMTFDQFVSTRRRVADVALATGYDLGADDVLPGFVYVHNCYICDAGGMSGNNLYDVEWMGDGRRGYLGDCERFLYDRMREEGMLEIAKSTTTA